MNRGSELKALLVVFSLVLTAGTAQAGYNPKLIKLTARTAVVPEAQSIVVAKDEPVTFKVYITGDATGGKLEYSIHNDTKKAAAKNPPVPAVDNTPANGDEFAWKTAGESLQDGMAEFTATAKLFDPSGNLYAQTTAKVAVDNIDLSIYDEQNNIVLPESEEETPGGYVALGGPRRKMVAVLHSLRYYDLTLWVKDSQSANVAVFESETGGSALTSSYVKNGWRRLWTQASSGSFEKTFWVQGLRASESNSFRLSLSDTDPDNRPDTVNVTVVTLSFDSLVEQTVCANGTSLATVTTTPSGRALTWELADNAIGASIVPQGSNQAVVTAQNQGGTVWVKAADAALTTLSDSKLLTVVKVTLDSLEPQTICVNGTSLATASVTPAGRALAWELVDNTIGATIVPQGANQAIVTAKDQGCTVLVRVKDYELDCGGETRELTVVKVALDSLVPQTICVNGTSLATAVVTPSGRALTWELVDNTIGATIVPQGATQAVVTAKDQGGTVLVRVKDYELDCGGETRQLTVVKLAFDSLVPEAICAKGTSLATAIVTPAGRALTWELVDNAIGATIAEKGLNQAVVTAHDKGGTVIVKVKDYELDCCGATRQLTVVKVTLDSLTPQTIVPNTTSLAKATVVPTGRTLKWELMDNTIGATLMLTGGATTPSAITTTATQIYAVASNQGGTVWVKVSDATVTCASDSKLLKVVRVKFSKANPDGPAGNAYGYDDMDTAAASNDDHVCVKSNGTTRVQVEVEGGAQGDLEFTGKTAGIVTLTKEGSAGDKKFLLKIDGLGHNKSETEVEARVGGATGPVAGKITAHVYSEVSCASGGVAYCYLSGRRALTIPTIYPTADLTDGVRAQSRWAVVDCTLGNTTEKAIVWDTVITNDLVDRVYGDPTDETDTVATAVGGLGASYKVAYLRDVIKRNWRLAARVVHGATQLVTTSTQNLEVGADYQFCNPAGNLADAFKIVAINTVTATVTIDTPVGAVEHLHFIQQTHGGIAGLATHPVLVVDEGVVGPTVETTAHELLHNVNGLVGPGFPDVDEATNVMHWVIDGTANTRPLRYKRIPEVETGNGTVIPGSEFSQWERVNR